MSRFLREFSAYVTATKGSAPAGNGPVALGPKRKTTTVTFGDDEGTEIDVSVARGDPGDTGVKMIQDQFVRLQMWIGDFWTNYKNGIDKFTNNMNFSSEQEAKPHFLQAAIGAFGKMALDAVLKAAGPVGEVLSKAKTVVEALHAEEERAAKAAGEVRIKAYLNGLIEGISKKREAMRAGADEGKQKFIDDFERLAKQDNLRGKASPDGRVVGEAAQVVLDVKAGVEAFHKAIPSAAHFQQEFTKRFANTPGRTDYVSHGGRKAGRLYFNSIHVKLEEKDGKRTWSVNEGNTADAWTLVTLQEHPERVAASLQESLEGAKPWQIDLPKSVEFRIEVEAWPVNACHTGSVSFEKSPDSFRTGGYGDLAAEAWKIPAVRARVLNTMKMEGSKS
jgi:hypothetical protein